MNPRVKSRVMRLALLLLALGFAHALAQSHQPLNESDVRVEASPYETPSVAQLRALPAESWPADVGGLALRYHLVSLEGFSSLGYFVFSPATQTCHIYIDTWLANHASQAEHLAVVFHEVGHCVDAVTLRSNHNAFVREGCVYGAYYCAPAEGYAEAWRYAYTARCGLDAATIGYEVNAADESATRCALPTAEAVLPPLSAEHLANTH